MLFRQKQSSRVSFFLAGGLGDGFGREKVSAKADETGTETRLGESQESPLGKPEQK
jgi:hypothetical protein